MIMLNDEKNLVSPVTGGPMILKWDLEKVEYRREYFEVWYPYYECKDTGNRFTTTESDAVWCNQMHQQYCTKYGIPFTDEIRALREKYGLSAQKMSLIMGFGENQWRKYEQDDIPSISNGRVIRSAMNPNMMLDFVESARCVLSEKEYANVKSRVQTFIDKRESMRAEEYELSRVFAFGRGKENGYAPISLSRLKSVILRVLERCSHTSSEMFITKMNKVLFYIDFISYRETGMAMTGLAYRAIDFGPVPERWDRVFSAFDEIVQEPRDYGEFEGQILVAKSKADLSVLSDKEIAIIDYICERLSGCSSREVSAMSHNEKAWIDHHVNRGIIPFADSFSLLMM